MLKCLECGREFSKMLALSVHVACKHCDINSYYDKYCRDKSSEGICQTCGKPTKFQGLRLGYSKYCSMNCCVKNQSRQLQHSNQMKTLWQDDCYRNNQVTKHTGIEQSEATIQKRLNTLKLNGSKTGSKSYKHTPEAIASMRKKLKGRRVSFEVRNRLSIAHTGMKHSEETKKKLSRLKIQEILDGRIPTKGGWGIRGQFFSLKNRREIRFDSLLEEKALMLFESLGSITGFDRCQFAIPYQWSDGTEHLYHPDFFVSSVLIPTVYEVKPSNMFQNDHNPEKFTAAEGYCKSKGWRFAVLTEKELGKQITALQRDSFEFSRMRTKQGVQTC